MSCTKKNSLIYGTIAVRVKVKEKMDTKSLNLYNQKQ